MQLKLVVGTCGALLVRDVWLMARGGGVAPRWMLAAEIAGFGTAATSGLLSLAGNVDDQGAKGRLCAASLGIASTLHAARLVIYLGRRDPSPSS
jgi:hypothetical protein